MEFRGRTAHVGRMPIAAPDARPYTGAMTADGVHGPSPQAARRAPRCALRVRVLLIALGGVPAVATAQDPAAPCDGRRITAIEVREPESTAVDEVRPPLLRTVVRAVLQTTPTKAGALRPYLLLREDGMCDEARRLESERLLRDLPYVADATVSAEPDGDGVRLVVLATEELKPVIGLRLDGATPSYLRFGTTSLGGQGIFLAGDWVDGGGYRDGFTVRAADWTVLGRRTTGSLIASRYPLGHFTELVFAEPFLTRFQSLAWRVSFRDETDFVRLQRNVDEPMAWKVDWQHWSAGVIGRIHFGSAQLLAGGAVLHDRFSPADSASVVGSDGLLPPSPALGGLFTSESGSRAGVIGGLRALSFRRAEGLEALEGAHDVARGVQVATIAGRGVSGDADKPFVAADVYTGVGGAKSFASARATYERRAEEGRDDSRLLGARLSWLWRVSRRQTQEMSVEYAGIWREDIPVAFFLDDRRSGPRGFDGATASGTRLLVGRFERRIRVGGFGRAMGLGIAGFADVAKLWSGDAPLGTTTEPQVGIGTGLLAAVPRGSRKTIRLDVAYPLTSADGANGLTVRLAVTTAGRAYWREPAAFVRSRIAPALQSLVGWF